MRRSSGVKRSLAGLAAVSLLVVFATPTLANNYVVNSTLDEPDADPSNGICSSTPSGACTLRAAIMAANFVNGPHMITLPAGTYKLKRPGYDDNALVGDLDIKHDLTIQGAGSGSTIIDGNGSITHDRVFQVFSTVQNLTLSGMTIRNGESLTNPSPTPSPAPVLGGGGIYIEGAANVHLSDVILDTNTGQNGGGIYANFSATGGSLTIDHAIVRNNVATAGGVGEGAGIRVYLPSSVSQFSIQDSQVYNNTADSTGGGFFVDGNSAIQWSILRTQVYSNMAASGGGIGNFVPLSLTDSSLHDNHASFDGGAMEAFAPYSIIRTTVSTNSAGRFGGGIFNLQESGSNDPNDPHNDFAVIVQSTFSGNFARYGGGIYHDGFITPASLLTLVNSTVSGNGVALGANSPAPSPSPSAAGGGLFIYGGRAQLFNTTVAFNRVQLGFGTHQYVGQGGGLYINGATTPSNFIARNSVIANNADGNGIMLDTADDGYTSGSVSGELAYNLFTTTANFFITGPQGGNIVGQDPVLSPLQDNGGPTQTRTLLSGSPAINAGAPGGCTDYTPSASPSPALMPLTSDQRGLSRPYPAPGPCDMGAVEVQPALSINDVSMAEGNSGTTSFVFTVTLAPASAQTVMVHFATVDGTATAGSDYQAASNTLTFNPGDTSKSVTVLVNGDTTFEPDEIFFVNLSSAVNAPIVKAQGIGTIVNDDAMPTPTATATATPKATPTASARSTATPTATPKATATATATPTATPSPTPGLVANVSTRLPVGTGNNVLIEGFIVQGPSGSKKKIIVRAIGPSLRPFGITDALANPTLEIRNSNNALIASNNDWKSTILGGIISSDQSAEITASGVAPSNDLESAIIANLAPGSYTAVVRGVNNSVGTGVVDAYDLSPGSAARLANIATRGLIQPGDKLMIAGFIVQDGPVKALILATGPSLTAFGINNALPDTTLQLRNQNGVIVREDDDWQTTQKAEIQATGLQPSDPREAAVLVTLQPGQYTAQVRGKPEATGIGVVQVYFLQ